MFGLNYGPLPAAVCGRACERTMIGHGGIQCDSVRAGMLIRFGGLRLIHAPEQDAEKAYVARRQSHPRTRKANPH